ncbi:MAG: hypothetical protein AAF170_11140 [Bacteroidota bacterium]
MRIALLALAILALTATAASQVGSLPKSRTIAIPITIQTGSGEIENRTASGISSPALGFTFVGLNSDLYVIGDVSGGMAAVVVCPILSCTGLTEEVGGVETGDSWFFYDGVLLRGDFGGLFDTPVGGVGGGLHLSFSGAEAGETFGWIDYGVQGAYGAAVGPLSILGTGTYAWGYEGESQTSSGRSVKVRADVVWPRKGIDVAGFVALDRRSDTRGTDLEADDFSGTFVTLGAGIGF